MNIKPIRLFSLVLLSICPFLVGCADMITYSKDSRREGIAAYNEMRYADAAGAFNNAVRQNPSDYMSYFYLGCSHDAMGQYQRAVPAYRTSLDVMKIHISGKYDETNRIRAITGLANCIARSDTRDIETNAAVERAQTQQTADAYLIVAKIHAARGDADSAIDAYDHALLMGREQFYVAKDYGLYLDRLNQRQRADAVLRRAYSIKQDDSDVNLALARNGIVPGPSIRPREDLARPGLPKGPIPEIDISRLSWSRESSAPTNPSGTVQAPRD